MPSFKRLLALLLALTQLLCLASCGSQPATEDPQPTLPQRTEIADMNSAYSEQIRAMCQEFVDTNQLMGLSVAVLDNGKASFLNFGLTDTDGAPITEHTQFEIASITKTFTSMLMAQMAADPAVALDIHARADSYLPFTLPEKSGKYVELWHLASHISGLYREPTNYVEGPNPYKDYDMDKLMEYSKIALLLYTPGERYLYSNLGAAALGLALTNAAGVDIDHGRGYEALLKQRILDPLGLSETGIFLSEEAIAAMAHPHQTSGNACDVWEFDIMAALGGLKSTTWDLTQYIAAAMGQIACDETIAAAFAECTTSHYSNGKQNLGLGFHLMTMSNGVTCCWHDGITYGSRSMLLFSQQTGQGVVVLCNNAVSVYDLGKALMEQILTA